MLEYAKVPPSQGHSPTPGVKQVPFLKTKLEIVHGNFFCNLESQIWVRIKLPEIVFSYQMFWSF